VNKRYLNRGKRLDCGDWVQGSLLYAEATVGDDILAVIVESMEWNHAEEFFNICKRYRIDPATIGRFTGLKDKNGKLISEGDIIYSGVYSPFMTGNYQVQYLDTEAKFILVCEKGNYAGFDTGMGMDVEIIGNIHDNPELLEVRND